MKLTNLTEASQALAKYVPYSRTVGSYDLKRMTELMNLLSNPQDSLKVIHIAGTSGKTSTSYYVAALLKQSGKKVGLTVSPHVSEVNERVQIDLTPLAEKIFCNELVKFLEIVEESDLKPSYFEVLVAFAYWEFVRQKVDYAVVEVGLGGLLDGTNVVNREDKVCIITDIGLDHINILGNTLPEIAAQKAGIIKTKNIVFCNRQAPEIINVFRKAAAVKQARLKVLDPDTINDSPDYLPLFQRRNFSLALSAAAYTLERDCSITLNSNQILKASEQPIPARMEIFEHRGKTIILDGAHNGQKLQALGRSLKAKYPGQKIAALISFVDGRSFRLESSMEELANFTDNLIITKFMEARQDLPYGPVAPDELEKLATAQGFSHIITDPDPKKAYAKLLEQDESILLITGSFYIMEDLRNLVKNS